MTIAGQSFNQNGVLSAKGAGAYTDTGIKSPTDNNQFFTRFDYDLSDKVKFHIQAVAELKVNDEYNTTNELTNVTISATNPYLPAAVQSALAASGTSSFTLSKVMSDMPPLINHTNEHQFYLNTGFEGKSGIFDWGLDHTDYNVSGKYWTWKIGANWRVDDSITFRGTISRDIRAPTLYDLYQTPSTVPLTRQDLLTLATPTVPSVNLGNPNLTAEIGKTKTLGVVVKPHFIPGFSLSVDYYHITIDNAILNIQGWNTYLQQACYQSGGSSSYCALQLRPDGYTNTSTSNSVTTWYAEAMNIAQIETMGADFEANYVTRIKEKPVAFRLFTTYQPHIYYRQPGVVTVDMGGAAGITTTEAPAWRVTATIDAQPASNVSVELRERWRSAMRMQGTPGLYFTSDVPSLAYTDFNLSVFMDQDHKKEFFLNVENAFNQLPPLYATSTTPAAGYAYGDDPVGRYFTVGFRAKF